MMHYIYIYNGHKTVLYPILCINDWQNTFLDGIIICISFKKHCYTGIQQEAAKKVCILTYSDTLYTIMGLQW